MISNGNHEEPSLEEEVYEPAPEPSLENLEEVKKMLHTLVLDNKVEYLENWRKDYLKRIGHIIDWTVAEPENYGDVISMIFKFEEFFTHMMMVIAESESLKKSYRQLQDSKNQKNVHGVEIG